MDQQLVGLVQVAPRGTNVQKAKYTQESLFKPFEQLLSSRMPYTLQMQQLKTRIEQLIRICIALDVRCRLTQDTSDIFMTNSAGVVELWEGLKRIAAGQGGDPKEHAQVVLDRVPLLPKDHVAELRAFRDGKLEAMVDDVIAYLNSVSAADPQALNCLIWNRVPANEALVQHPHVGVNPMRALTSGQSLDALGLLNGLLSRLGIPEVELQFAGAMTFVRHVSETEEPT